MYIIELFSDKADQVKLATFLLSALLAILVLLLNQYFAQRKARQEYLLEKIEEVARLSIEYTDLCSEILNDVKQQAASKHIEYPEISDRHQRAVTAIIRKLELIFGLYFKGAGFDPNDYQFCSLKVFYVLSKRGFFIEGQLDSLFKNAEQHISNSDAKLAVLCAKLVKRFGHKI
ncbi:hypothetical protein V6237_01840 [Pseudoalteromonas carrageenovora]|uniref:hypothetical protein n=1 Tax=Pseudoalteromonas carrageenovora TaxID=227 RepID=UPI00311DD2EA